ncbi:MAG: hypothetical protein JOZ58_00920 [Acetobacteraceae bacterium]|nr:hypothetical protein [Acetobacteraceae bacterium]
MPTHVQIIRASDFLIATPKGQLDFPKSKKLLTSLVSASTAMIAHEVLLDVRSTQVELSATDLWHLAAGLGRRGTEFPDKIAVVCRSSGAGRAEFFALCARNRGFPVGAFTSFEGAVEWLSADRTRFVEDFE